MVRVYRVYLSTESSSVDLGFEVSNCGLKRENVFFFLSLSHHVKNGTIHNRMPFSSEGHVDRGTAVILIDEYTREIQTGRTRIIDSGLPCLPAYLDPT